MLSGRRTGDVRSTHCLKLIMIWALSADAFPAFP